MKAKITTALLAAVLYASIFLSCASSGTGASDTTSEDAETKAGVCVSGSEYPLTITDYFGYETTLDSLPERVAVLAGTPLNIWYDLGGKSVCTSEISSNIKLTEAYADEMLALPEVGTVYSLDIEAVAAQKPDLIITQAGVQTTATESLRSLGFKVITVLARDFNELTELYKVFGALLGVPDTADKKINELTEGRAEIIDKLPTEGKRVVIFYLTSNSLAVKLSNSISGAIADDLGLDNIAADLPPDTIGSENTPLDIEYVAEKDPDIVLVSSMIGSNELAVETMEKYFADNQAWQTITAVREGRVYYLPQEYFLYNAGPYYDQAVRYMACTVYPEIFGEVSEWYK